MRKRPISTTQEPLITHDERWIDIETANVCDDPFPLLIFGLFAC